MVGLIYRAEEFSPNGNVPRDAAILEAVGQRLRAMGQEVRFFGEAEFPSAAELQTFDACLSMARRQSSLLALQKAQLRGLHVLNRPNAVQITVQSRSSTLEMLQAAGIPVVPFWSYEPSADEMFQCEPELQTLLPGWVKAMHPRGVTAGDVSRVATPLEADCRVLEMAAQGYTDIIVTRHLEGPLLKTYVVADAHWSVGADEPSGIAEIAAKVRRTLGLDIFGIDFILTSDGPLIIDVNDFPSFGACRDEAAEAIAELVLRPSRP